MKTKSKYYHKLATLLVRPLFRVKEAEDFGVPRRALAYLCEIGVLERVFRGVYRAKAYEPEVDLLWASLAEAVSTIPQGVICLISALSYYDLTDEMSHENWIVIPHAQRAPVREGVRIVRMRNIALGSTETSIGEYNVKIFDRERCIIDAFRYLSHEIAIKALKAYFEDGVHVPSIGKLSGYAKKLRVDIKPYILSLTT